MTEPCTPVEIQYVSLLDEIQPGWRTGKDITAQTKNTLRSRFYELHKDIMEGPESVSTRSLQRILTSIRKKTGIYSARSVSSYPIPCKDASLPESLKLIYNALSDEIRSQLDQSNLPTNYKVRVLTHYKNLNLNDTGKRNVIAANLLAYNELQERLLSQKIRRAQRKKFRNFENREENRIKDRNEMIDRLFARIAEDTKQMNLPKLKFELEELLLSVWCEDIPCIIDTIRSLEANTTTNIACTDTTPQLFDTLPTALPLPGFDLPDENYMNHN